MVSGGLKQMSEDEEAENADFLWLVCGVHQNLNGTLPGLLGFVQWCPVGDFLETNIKE